MSSDSCEWIPNTVPPIKKGRSIPAHKVDEASDPSCPPGTSGSADLFSDLSDDDKTSGCGQDQVLVSVHRCGR